MGGNAFTQKGYIAERMTKDTFERVEDEVIQILNSLNIESLKIPYVREKETFGDIDLIVVKQHDRNVKEVITSNISKFGLTDEFINLNKDVISILYEEKYQIDFIFTPEEYKYYHMHYLSYNDLGNLIGRVVKESGYQHGHNGLFYVYREGNHYKELIKLSNNYYDVLDILTLDVEKFKKGFDTFHEMFDFVIASKYFKRSRFDLENLNNRNRVRDRKRKVYNQFIEYIKNIDESEYITPSPFERFPWLIKKCEDIKESRRELNEIKEKFNGRKVHEWTGLSGTDKNKFGEFMQFVKSDSNFDHAVKAYNDEEMKEYVVNLYEIFNKTD